MFEPARVTYLTREFRTSGALPVSKEEQQLMVSPLVPLTVEESAPEHLRLETDVAADKNSSGALLVLADQFFPGWQVQIDGKAAELIRANGFQRAVFVPPGHHTVMFDYTPRSLILALRLSLLGCLALVVFAALVLARRRKVTKS